MSRLDWLIDRLKIQTDECQEWPFCKLKSGYGKIVVEQKSWLVHRFVFHLRGESLPNTLEALHRCDNPSCFNPTHLFIGTQADNLRDMNQKERRGGQVKASTKAAIAADLMSDMTKASIAERYNVHLSTVCRVANANRISRRRGARGERNANAKLNTEQVATIIRRTCAGESKANLAREFNVSRSLISAITLGRIWQR